MKYTQVFLLIMSILLCFFLTCCLNAETESLKSENKALKSQIEELNESKSSSSSAISSLTEISKGSSEAFPDTEDFVPYFSEDDLTRRDELVQQAIQLLKQKKYGETTEWFGVVKNQYPHSLDETVSVLYCYAIAKGSLEMSEPVPKMAEMYCAFIDPKYSGEFSEEVHELGLSVFGDVETWKQNYDPEKIKSWIKKYNLKDDPQLFKNMPPTIGMDREQLELCSWGKPTDINRTITARTVTEQWVYPENRYVYLTDGKVTGIQD